MALIVPSNSTNITILQILENFGIFRGLLRQKFQNLKSIKRVKAVPVQIGDIVTWSKIKHKKR